MPQLTTLISEFLYRHRSQQVSIWFQMVRRHQEDGVTDLLQIVVAVDAKQFNATIPPEELDGAGMDLLAIKLDWMLSVIEERNDDAVAQDG